MSMIRSTFRRNLCRIFPKVSTPLAGRSMSAHTMEEKSKEDLEGEISTYYGKSAAKNYAQLFGNNRHFGYFPHLSDPSKPECDFTGSTSALTMHMAEVAEIDSESSVIDLDVVPDSLCSKCVRP